MCHIVQNEEHHVFEVYINLRRREESVNVDMTFILLQGLGTVLILLQGISLTFIPVLLLLIHRIALHKSL